MRFLSKRDKINFLVEIGETELISNISSDFKPTKEMMELFIKRRAKVIPGLKDFRKSQIAKHQWRRNRNEMMKAIKKFHKSIEGKKFHRKMGNFLATRIFRDPLISNGFIRAQQNNESLMSVLDVLKSLSSLRTHVYIFSENYKSVSEEIDFQIFKDELLHIIAEVETELELGTFSLTDEKLNVLLYSVPERVLMDYVSSELGGDFNAYMLTLGEKIVIESDDNLIEILKSLR